MKVTTSKLVSAACLAAVIAGLTFVVIQFVHPSDALASVTQPAWALVHYATIAMLTLFAIGITGIYIVQIQKAGWLGLAGLVVLGLGLLLTGAGAVVEAFVEPKLAGVDPAYVHSLLAMVEGDSYTTDLGALPTLWSLSSVCFLAGTILFGVASLRAGVVPRLASAMFGFGLVVSAPLVALLGTPRVAAVPIGLGLAWMGFAAWQVSRAGAAEREPTRAMVVAEGATA